MAEAKKINSSKYPDQEYILVDGNESAAWAAKHINFHVMGYYPITPSTQIAETLDAMKANGEHEIVMIPGDGEHGAAGISYGASLGGGRVFNATSANGLMYALEELPVQSGTRFPMVLALISRSVSGPLDIRNDHSDLYYAMNTGWIILLAKDPQMVYDMLIMAVRVGEHEDVRLPVIVNYDGFFTSHQKRKVSVFGDRQIVQEFLGPVKTVYHALDPRNPLTLGPYMNDPDLINNKKQLSMAMENALKVIPTIFDEYAKLSGRKYGLVNAYKTEDADVVIFIINSAFDTTTMAVDLLRSKGMKVGAVMPNVLRPFPQEEVFNALKDAKVVIVAEKNDIYGAWGATLYHEVKSLLYDRNVHPEVISRIYGIGGKEFYLEDAVELFEEGFKIIETGKVEKRYEYHGATPGNAEYVPKRVVPPISPEENKKGIYKIEEKDGKIIVKGASATNAIKLPRKVVPGHGACPGCGIFSAVETFLRGMEGDIVVLFQTGCGMVVTTGYPYSSHRITYIHNLFQNGAATLSGLVEMFKEKQRRGEIPDSEDITFVMITGDGGMDIGLGPALGTAARNHKLIILEYDNESYANTGYQLSYSTPMGHRTSTSNVGPYEKGKAFHHKDTPQIFAAAGIPYVFTSAEPFYKDLIIKGAKAQKIAKEKGMVYGKVLIACPPGWSISDEIGNAVVEAAVNSCFFPLYEVEEGITTLNYDPEKKGKKVPVSDWLKMMGKTRHLLKPENKHILDEIQREVDRRWIKLKAKAEHPLL